MKRDISKATWKFHYRLARMGNVPSFHFRCAFESIISNDILYAAQMSYYGVAYRWGVCK